MRNFFADFYERKSRFLADFFFIWNIENDCFYRKIWVELDGVLTIAIRLAALMRRDSLRLLF